MNDLLKTRFFGLLSKATEKVTNFQIKNAYAEFIKQVEIMSSSDDYSLIIRTISVTRIELASLELALVCEKGEKCLIKKLLCKSHFNS